MRIGSIHIKQILTICIIAIVCLWYGTVLAQTLTATDKTADQKMWEIALKLIFPAIWTGIAPWITSVITKNMASLPATVKVTISTVLGTLMAGVAGAVPDFPLTIESAATMGAAGGATGQVLLNMTPPTKVVAKAEEPKV